ncbi:MAG: glucose-1-phosphate adenylyltransferase subunit GlgD [Corallococcus sp.]|nr:glucose-1-phosphate adenylyltransferase subunit GlgD [Corallococcus sp.]
MRTISAVPFGGRYRMVDFVLSAMVNSGIANVGIATDHNYQSLINHLGSGKPWDLARKKEGLFILPPSSRDMDLTGDSRVQLLCGIQRYLERSKEHYVVIAEGNNVCNIRFDKIVERHKQNNADITVVYQKVKEKTAGEAYLDVGEDESAGGVVYNSDRKKCLNRVVGYYVFTKDLLINLLEYCARHGRKNFFKDVIERNIGKLNVYGYCFDGFLRSINDVQSYYDVSMDLFEFDNRKSIFIPQDKIYTKSKDRVPTRYQKNAEVKNSIVADGCVIDGTVENSIIFRGVSVSKGAVVKNSIVMQDAIISSDAHLECCILDKNCIVKKGKTLIGQPDFPIVLGKHRTI